MVAFCHNAVAYQGQQHLRRSMRPLIDRFYELRFALSVGLWLLTFPVRWRSHSVPDLLQHLSSIPPGKSIHTIPMDRAIVIIGRVCHLAIFRVPIFPRICLRQALALYRFLRPLGYPVTIHIGVQKSQDTLSAHSWVTLAGTPLTDDAGLSDYKVVYSFPESGLVQS